MTAIMGLLNQIGEEEVVLPAIQRDFVWSEAQTAKLLDSIMRGYPVGIVLLWEPITTSSTGRSSGISAAEPCTATATTGIGAGFGWSWTVSNGCSRCTSPSAVSVMGESSTFIS
jgi:hypothetical protein